MKIRYKILIGVLAIFALAIVYLYYLSWPRQSYILKTDVVTDQNSYQVGDTMGWSMTICKLYDSQLYSQRIFENQETGKQYPIPEINTKASLNKGDCTTVHPTVVISRDIGVVPGVYKLHVEIYPLGSALNVLPFNYYTNEFTIK